MFSYWNFEVRTAIFSIPFSPSPSKLNRSSNETNSLRSESRSDRFWVNEASLFFAEISSLRTEIFLEDLRLYINSHMPLSSTWCAPSHMENLVRLLHNSRHFAKLVMPFPSISFPLKSIWISLSFVRFGRIFPKETSPAYPILLSSKYKDIFLSSLRKDSAFAKAVPLASERKFP